MALARKQTIKTERPSLVSEVSANLIHFIQKEIYEKIYAAQFGFNIKWKLQLTSGYKNQISLLKRFSVASKYEISSEFKNKNFGWALKHNLTNTYAFYAIYIDTPEEVNTAAK
jgi:hypothetical protein